MEGAGQSVVAPDANVRAAAAGARPLSARRGCGQTTRARVEAPDPPRCRGRDARAKRRGARAGAGSRGNCGGAATRRGVPFCDFGGIAARRACLLFALQQHRRKHDVRVRRLRHPRYERRRRRAAPDSSSPPPAPAHAMQTTSASPAPDVAQTARPARRDPAEIAGSPATRPF